jgi:hypothetical protein
MSLREALHVEDAPADELVATLGLFFGASRWEGGRVIEYFQDGQLALRVVYEKHGFRIHDVERGLGLTDLRLSELQAQIEEAILGDHGTVVCREFLCSGLRIEGHWRFADQWQILPAPDGAPTLDVEMGLHPFVIEFRVRESSDWRMRTVRRERRIWELHLLLSLLLQAGVDRIDARMEHFWAYVFDDDDGESRYVQEMYFAPGFVALESDFSDTSSLGAITEVAEDDYFGRRGIGAEHSPLQVPDSLRDIAARLDSAAEHARDKFLLSAYWRDRSRKTWNISTSLSYVSAVNALEVLVPESEGDPCPECGLDRSPGPTRKVKQLLDTHAPGVDFGDRAKLYRLRSRLVHGHALMGHDLPRALGALVPHHQDDLDTFRAALHASRLVAVGWLRANTS